MNQKFFQNNFQNHLDRTVKGVFSTIDEFGMLSGGDRVLVSISGGPDSTFLTFALNMLKKAYDLKLFALHLDHMTRNGESSNDAEFVAGLCKDLGIKLFASRTDVRQWCRQHKLSFQEGARKLRLQFLTIAADKCRADRIATGHNADDNVETFFMHLARGAGLKGLSGIRPVNLKFIRQDNDLISGLAEKEFKKTASLESNPATGEIFLVKLPLARLAKMHPVLTKRIIIKSIEMVK